MFPNHLLFSFIYYVVALGGGPLITWEHLMEGRGLKLKCMTVQSWRTGLKSKRSKRWTEGWRKWGFEERHQRIKVKIQNSKRWKEKQGDEKGETLVESFWENKFPKEAIELINYTYQIVTTKKKQLTMKITSRHPRRGF